MILQPHSHRRQSRRLSTCHRHPVTTPVTGFCASCLRERLAGIQNDSTTTTPTSSTSSTSQLRRSKSCSGGLDPSSSSASELRRKSCDVGAHNTLHDLFADDDKIKTFNVNFPPSNVKAFVDLEGGEEEGELKTMKEFIDLECGRKKDSGKSLWEAASVFSKKFRKWKKKQTRKEKNEGLVLEKANRRGLRDTQSEIGEYGLFGRRSCDTDTRLSVDFGRFSVDEPRFSIDEPRFSIDEPRSSWDGCLIGKQNPMVKEEAEERLSVVKEEERISPGGSAQTRDYYGYSLTRRRKSFDRSLQNRKISLGESDDFKSSISNAKVSPETVRLFHGAKLLVTEKELRDSNWYSNVESGSREVELIANGGVVQKAFNLSKARGWKNVWSIWGLIQRRKQNVVGDEDRNFGGDVGNGRLAESVQKLRMVVNGDEDRGTGGNAGEGILVDSSQKLRRFANGDVNVDDATLAESLQKLRRVANGIENVNVVREKLLRSYSVSARNSVDRSSFYRTSVTDAKGHRLQPNRSVRYSPNNLDNGLLRFYLTPWRSYRRSKSGSRLRNSNSIGGSIL